MKKFIFLFLSFLIFNTPAYSFENFDECKVFKELLNICLKLPNRFHRWYGDQYSLKKYIEGGFDEFQNLDTKIYLNVLREQLKPKYLENAFKENVQLITFKGPDSKTHLEQAVILLDYFCKNMDTEI